MIRPVIDYVKNVNVVGISCDEHCLNRVLKLQKRSTEVVLADCQASSVKLFSELNWIPFFEQAKLTKCCIVYKRLQGNVPIYLKGVLATLIHGILDMSTSILLAPLTNDKLKEEEHLL